MDLTGKVSSTNNGGQGWGSGREGDDRTKLNHMNYLAIKTVFIPPFETSKSKQSSFKISSQDGTRPASEKVYDTISKNNRPVADKVKITKYKLTNKRVSKEWKRGCSGCNIHLKMKVVYVLYFNIAA